MGFIHINHVMSLEEIYTKFKNESQKKDINDIKIFDGFKFNVNMTLEEFEEQNSQVYKQYEGINTEFNSPEYKQASFEEKLVKFAKIYKKYYPEDAEDLDKKIEEMAKKAEQNGEFTYANFLKDVNVIAPKFGLDKDPTKEEYVEPDPTMCRDPETHDW